MWWAGIDGLGATGAKRIEAFFAQYPQLTERAHALIAVPTHSDIAPWEVLRVPEDVDGSYGVFRAPRKTCSLNADNDYQAVNAWLSLHETPSTLRAYRKEAERLILWAALERGVAMSSLTAEDAVAYRAFLRRPASRWMGPSLSRTSPEWRPFTGPLCARSVAYALSVLGAMYRWLMEQGYVLTNPFAGIKVRGATRTTAMEIQHVFSDGEWALIRTIADGLEWSYGWTAPAAQRLRFILDFAYATGLRISELVEVSLRSVHVDDHDDHWLRLVGKGSKPGKVALPPLARSALQRYLVQRGLPTTPSMWIPSTKLIGAMGLENQSGISATRLWVVMKRFFETAAGEVEQENPALAEKLRKATPHWMRHTHATHALARGVELTSVRDNLRHASIATTSIYLHGDDVKRAKQMGSAFLVRD
jgi:site-specific recombinase XerD